MDTIEHTITFQSHPTTGETNDVRRVGHARQSILCRLKRHNPVYSTVQAAYAHDYAGGKPVDLDKGRTIYVTSCDHQSCKRAKAKG
jgi:hypothetical protein